MEFRLREYFSFTDRERNGTIVLLLLVTGLLFFLFVEDKFVSLPAADFTECDRLIASLPQPFAKDSLKSSDEETHAHIPDPARQSVRPEYRPAQLFVFDPNGLPEQDWVRLGLSPAQAKAVKSFESKGGKFESKQDVKKLFVISDEKYAELEPYIALPEKKESAAFTEKKENKPRIVELNTADSLLLIGINGIGPAFAHRILAYREKLGGFHSVEQLKEVFGIDEEHYSLIEPAVKADSSYIRRIDINTVTVSDLRRHPYMGPAVAQALVSYRKQHGNFRSVADIRGCKLITPGLYEKIAPYLSI